MVSKAAAAVVHPPEAWVAMRRVASSRDGPMLDRWRQGTANARRLGRRVRNDHLVDGWSASHFAWGAGLAMLVGPWWSFALMVAWEPFEVFLLGPLLSRKGIAFGHETWRNSASDVVFDGAGAAAAYLVLRLLWDPLGVL
jgi:hypothetical protein